MSLDPVTLGFILRSRETGVLNGAEVRDETVVVLSEQAEPNYRLAPATQSRSLQTDRAALEAVPACALTTCRDGVTRRAPARSKARLKKAAISRLRKLRKSPQRVRNYFEHKPVRYAA